MARVIIALLLLGAILASRSLAESPGTPITFPDANSSTHSISATGDPQKRAQVRVRARPRSLIQPLPHASFPRMLPVLFVLDNGATVRGNVYPDISLAELKALVSVVIKPFTGGEGVPYALTAPFLRDDGVETEVSHRGLGIETDAEVASLLAAARARAEPTRFGVLSSRMGHAPILTLESAMSRNWTSVAARYLMGGITPDVVQTAFSSVPTTALLELMLEWGLDLNAWTMKIGTPQNSMMQQAAAHDVSLLTLVIIKVFSSHGLMASPPHNGLLDVIRFMLERGSNPNLPLDGSYMPLGAAVDSNSTEVLRLLLNHGAEGVTGQHLHTAIVKMNVASVRLLLGAGGDPNAAIQVHNAQGARRTALEQALLTKDRAIRLHLAKLLLDAGASSAIVTNSNFGHTPLHTAADGNDEELVRLLLEHDADVNAKMQDGRTALRMLREKVYGGNTGRDNFGRGHRHPPLTPEAEAVVKRIIKMLEAKGASD
jgi:ankyrin repeat protein